MTEYSEGDLCEIIILAMVFYSRKPVETSDISRCKGTTSWLGKGRAHCSVAGHIITPGGNHISQKDNFLLKDTHILFCREQNILWEKIKCLISLSRKDYCMNVATVGCLWRHWCLPIANCPTLSGIGLRIAGIKQLPAWLPVLCVTMPPPTAPFPIRLSRTSADSNHLIHTRGTTRVLTNPTDDLPRMSRQ